MPVRYDYIIWNLCQINPIISTICQPWMIDWLIFICLCTDKEHKHMNNVNKRPGGLTTSAASLTPGPEIEHLGTS